MDNKTLAAASFAPQLTYYKDNSDEADDIMEDSVPLSTNKIRKRNKHFKSAKSLSKRKIESGTSSDESDDLQGFIVNDSEEDDIMDEIEEEKPKKK